MNHRRSTFALALAFVFGSMSFLGCRTTSSGQRAEQSDARADASVAVLPDGAPTSAPPAASSSGAPKKVRARALGSKLGDFVIGAEPGPEHPQGTIVAVEFGSGDAGGRAGLTEVDVATGREVRQTGPLVSVSGVVRLYRDRDAFHLFTVEGTSLVWITTSRELKVSARVTKPSGGSGAAEARLVDAAVVDGRAFVVLEQNGGASNGVKVRVLDPRGTLLATHDCRAHAPVGDSSILRRVGGLVVVTELRDDEATPILCGIRAVGTGAPIVRKVPEAPIGVFVRDGVAYVEGEIRRLDENFKPTGPVLDDPRSCPDRPADCDSSESVRHCEGMGGDAIATRLRSGNAWVIRTLGCCGGPPGGVFACEDSSVSAASAH